MAITSDIRLKINDVFAEEGIEISFPQLDVHMRNADDAALPPAAAVAEDSPVETEEKKA